MHGRYRDASIAAVIFLGTLVIWGLGWWAGQTAEYYGTPYYEQEQQAGPRSDKIDGGTIMGTTSRTYQYVCANPQDALDADLCQQWRNANAARDMVVYSGYQVVLGVVGVLGLFATIYFAREAAKAGYKAASETKRIGEAQVRAYLTCTGGEFSVSLHVVSVKVNVKNTGQSPAEHCVVQCNIAKPSEDGQGFIKMQPLTGEIFNIGSDLQGNITIFFDKRHVDPQTLDELVHTEWPVILECFMRWTDIFGETHTLPFYLLEDRHGVTRRNESDPRSGTMSATNTRPQNPAQNR